MSIENDMTAKVLGKILAEGMSLAGCNMESRIESEALEKLKEIKGVISSNQADKEKVESVEQILTEWE